MPPAPHRPAKPLALVVLLSSLHSWGQAGQSHPKVTRWRVTVLHPTPLGQGQLPISQLRLGVGEAVPEVILSGASTRPVDSKSALPTFTPLARECMASPGRQDLNR